MNRAPLKIVILGLSITSSWGNGHAATYRGIVKGLNERGHDVLFLERDAEWYASNRDMPVPPFCRTGIYSNIDELKERFTSAIRNADFVIVGSYVPEGIAVGEWATRTALGKTAFYDIDTPVTIEKLASNECDYLALELIPRYDIYLSFTGGPTLDKLEKEYGAKMAKPLYCSVDPDLYWPMACEQKWNFGYMGTYSPDRQPPLDLLMIEPARRWGEGRFVVAGPMYPKNIKWPGNVERIIHVAPDRHCAFYNSQRFTLNVTRADMIRAGYSPSVRLFEAALCGTPIISDYWAGLEEYLEPGSEILISRSSDDTLGFLLGISERDAKLIGERARARILDLHTSRHRAVELEELIRGL